MPSGTGYVETIVHRFTAGADGDTPYSGLVKSDNEFVGDTWGGIHGHGSIYSLSGSTLTTLHALRISEGTEPEALSADTLGNVYGATAYGGGNPHACAYSGCGTIFQLMRTRSGFVFSLLHAFNGNDGYSPRGAMEFAGSVYGALTRDRYYNYGGGAIYKYVLSGPAKGSITEIHDFTVFDQGLWPGGFAFGPGVTAGPGGKLYGLTVSGGVHACTFGNNVIGCGVFYSITP